jgi:hypothetical protein
MAHQPKQVAQPRKAPEPPKPIPGRALSKKAQEDYVAEAHALAESLGFCGDDEFELREIRVVDAKGYLTKVFHEIHQAALNDHMHAPSAEQVCEHLGVDDPAEVKLVGDVLVELAKREAADAPRNAATATLTPEPRAVSMSANLQGSASTMMGGIINPTGKKG